MNNLIKLFIWRVVLNIYIKVRVNIYIVKSIIITKLLKFLSYYILKIIINKNYVYETLILIEHLFHMIKNHQFNLINNLMLS